MVQSTQLSYRNRSYLEGAVFISRSLKKWWTSNFGLMSKHLRCATFCVLGPPEQEELCPFCYKLSKPQPPTSSLMMNNHRLDPHFSWCLLNSLQNILISVALMLIFAVNGNAWKYTAFFK